MTSFYEGKRVLVTGGCSFVGSHLSESLVKDKAIVTIVDDLSSGEIQNISAIHDKVSFIEGDLRDSSTAIACTKDKDIVFHLANIHGGRGFIETHPGEISQNFLIDGNIFRSCHSNNVERVCFTSSACACKTRRLNV